ncbi:DnaJ family domain-containing protein [Bellilinea sp.]|jgi:DnaJ family protein C protein 28|uniref:DnaJ family domain-containing protein n=1 Tax=Bellilinea sp. TaxID=2838785 RepID=UPI002ADE2766|nr:DnaJ family domain-containing protein [Bellilinea sp.]
MNIFEWVAEEKIRSAIESGQWDNLPGKGKPLQWQENPFEPPEWRMAFSLLRQNGFSLPWLEERKEIEAEVQQFRAQLALGLRSANVMEVKDWAKSQIDRLNRRIFRYNLGVPLDRFQVTSLNLEQEVERAQPVSD